MALPQTPTLAKTPPPLPSTNNTPPPIIQINTPHILHTTTVISSTKLNHKVTQILRFLELLPPPLSHPQARPDTTTTTASVDDLNTTSTLETLQTKPSPSNPPIVAITTRAATANKLISVVEIVKRSVIADRARESAAGVAVNGKALTTAPATAVKATTKQRKVYQYTAITGVLPPPVPVLAPRVKEEAATNEPGQLKLKKGRKRKRALDDTATVERTEEGNSRQDHDKPSAGAHTDADDFETRPSRILPPAADPTDTTAVSTVPTVPLAVTALRDGKERKTPMLTIYLSTQSIPELKELYMEQVA